MALLEEMAANGETLNEEMLNYPDQSGRVSARLYVRAIPVHVGTRFSLESIFLVVYMIFPTSQPQKHGRLIYLMRFDLLWEILHTYMDTKFA